MQVADNYEVYGVSKFVLNVVVACMDLLNTCIFSKYKFDEQQNRIGEDDLEQKINEGEVFTRQDLRGKRVAIAIVRRKIGTKKDQLIRIVEEDHGLAAKAFLIRENDEDFVLL